MPREPRIQYENAWYHVMNRAAGNKYIFNEENNKYIFFDIIKDIQKKYDIEIHAYCLMDNHYHLLVKTPKLNLPKAIGQLQCKYAKVYNKISLSNGPIFRDRYKSILVENESYLLQVCRYIHLNPVEANLPDGIDYAWSSYNFYVNNMRKPKWLTTDMLIYMLDANGNIDKFKLFHKSDNSKELTNFYRNLKEQRTSLLKIDDLKKIIDLYELDEITRKQLDNNQDTAFDVYKFVLCYVARNIYNYQLNDISQYLNNESKKKISALLQRHKLKINSKLKRNLLTIKDNPELVISKIITRLVF